MVYLERFSLYRQVKIIGSKDKFFSFRVITGTFEPNNRQQRIQRLQGDKAYLLGDRPTSIDSSIDGSLVQIYRVSAFTAPIIDAAGRFKNLIDYAGRFHRQYFAGSS